MKKKNIFIFISILTFCFIFLNSKLIQNNQSKFNINKNSVKLMKNDNCDSEWIQINNFYNIRKNLIFFYIDKNQLEMYVERHQNHNLTLNLSIITDSVKIQLYNLNITKLHQHSEFVFDCITAKANIKLPIFKLNLLVQLLNQSIFIENVQLRNYNESNLINKSVLCSKVFYFKPEYRKNFEWWIELAKLNGYEKLFFFNNSLPVEYDFIKNKYSNFVESIDFNCIPNYISPTNSNSSYLSSFNQLKDIYNIDPLYYHMHFEFVTQNECYLNNINKYKFVSILDQDEAILKRQIAEIQVINKTSFSNIKMDEKKCQNQKWPDYFTGLKSRIAKSNDLGYLDSKVGGESYHFLMALYLNYRVVEKIFISLDKVLNSSFLNETQILIDDREDYNFFGKKGINFTILIRNKEEYDYALSLSNFFKSEIEPFLFHNRAMLKSLPENFSRFFFVYGDTTSWMCGKSFHFAKLSHWVSTHYPEKNDFFNMIWVPHEYGHVSHFRESLKDLHNKNISIRNINFDFNYFLCYFKPIVNYLKYA